MFRIFYILLLISLLWPFSLRAEESNEARIILETVRSINKADFCGEIVPLASGEIKERLELEMLLMQGDRAQIILWLKRSGKYFPVISSILKQEGLPDDLKYIPVIESALRPHAKSSKGAVGYWQFIQPTAITFGLTVTDHIDQRNNIYLSTAAACRYLKFLYEKFGSWTLAAAAYNMGENGLNKSILNQGDLSFYRLYLPIETQRYVFRIVAAKLIMESPAKYGIIMKPEDYYKPVPFERTIIKCTSDVPIKAVADAAGTDYKMIKDLNPEIKGGHIRKGSHEIALPKGSLKNFHKHFAKELKNNEPVKGEYYVVEQGDTLYGIAAKFNIPLSSLVEWNKIDPSKHLRVNERLLVKPPPVTK